MSLPYPWLHNKPACFLLHPGFLLGLLFSPEDGGDMFLQNFGLLSAGYKVLYPVR
jgi:hypothetical protein